LLDEIAKKIAYATSVANAKRRVTAMGYA